MISLAAAKAHLIVDFDCDNELIERLITAAVDHLKSLGVDTNADPLPPAIEQAAMMLVANFYKYREAMSDYEHFSLDIGVDRLIAPYREHSI